MGRRGGSKKRRCRVCRPTVDRDHDVGLTRLAAQRLEGSFEVFRAITGNKDGSDSGMHMANSLDCIGLDEEQWERRA